MIGSVGARRGDLFNIPKELHKMGYRCIASYLKLISLLEPPV